MSPTSATTLQQRRPTIEPLQLPPCDFGLEDNPDVFQEFIPEERRLQRLKEIEPRDPSGQFTGCFDAIAKVAHAYLKPDVVLINLLYDDSQWFKAAVNDGGRGAPMDDSVCAFSLLPARPEVLYLQDTAKDPRFKNNLFMLGPADIQFYAGVPLVTQDGARLGVMCCIGHRPRTLSRSEMRLLVNLGELVMRELIQNDIVKRLRPNNPLPEIQSPKRLPTLKSMKRIRESWFERGQLEGVMIVDSTTPMWQVVWHNPTWEKLAGTAPQHRQSLWSVVRPQGTGALLTNKLQKQILSKLCLKGSGASLRVRCNESCFDVAFNLGDGVLNEATQLIRLPGPFSPDKFSGLLILIFTRAIETSIPDAPAESALAGSVIGNRDSHGSSVSTSSTTSANRASSGSSVTLTPSQIQASLSTLTKQGKGGAAPPILVPEGPAPAPVPAVQRKGPEGPAPSPMPAAQQPGSESPAPAPMPAVQQKASQGLAPAPMPSVGTSKQAPSTGIHDVLDRSASALQWHLASPDKLRQAMDRRVQPRVERPCSVDRLAGISARESSSLAASMAAHVLARRLRIVAKREACKSNAAGGDFQNAKELAAQPILAAGQRVAEPEPEGAC